jgi:glycosyltransferase involved in cell wall biosynthesis
MLNILYISYDGFLEPLGQSQVLSYLEGLSNERHIHLISFEKPEDRNNKILFDQIDARIVNANIKWHPLTYHKKPTLIATLWDISKATILSFWLVLRYRLRIVHARSYVPSIVALLLKKIMKVKYIFDMRGFWADERVDGDIWPRDSYLYHISKKLEKYFLLNADVVISLTHKAVSEMSKFSYLRERTPDFKVITTCTDLDLFKPKYNLKYNEKKIKPFIVGYVGSVGVWYLFEEALAYYKLIKEAVPNAQLHIINKGGHNYINKCLEEADISKESVLLEARNHLGVVDAMQSMDLGLFIIKPLYSKMSSMPTKLGEFLGCGVPCVCNSGIGDMADIVNNEKVGIVLNSLEKKEKKESILHLLKLIKDSRTKDLCRKAALKYFSLEDGINSYKNIYHSLDVKP